MQKRKKNTEEVRQDQVSDYSAKLCYKDLFKVKET